MGAKSKVMIAAVVFLAFGYCSTVDVARQKLGSTPVGESCTSNDECLWYPEKTECNDLFDLCWCKSGYSIIPRPNATSFPTCEPIRNELGMECVEKSQCNLGTPGLWSDCLPIDSSPGAVKVCTCLDGYFNVPGEHECLREATQVGNNCKVLLQCTRKLGDLSRCYQRRCDCIPGQSVPNYFGNRCVPIVNIIGDPCVTHEQCQLGAPGNWSECLVTTDPATGTFCQCQTNAIQEPGKHVCYKKAELVGDECEVDVQCTANLGDIAECNEDRRCQCQNGAPIGSSTCL